MENIMTNKTNKNKSEDVTVLLYSVNEKKVKSFENEDKEDSLCLTFMDRVCAYSLVYVVVLIILIILQFIDIIYTEPLPVSNHEQYSSKGEQTLNTINGIHNEKVVSCYYNTPGRQMSHQLMPSDIHPHLCTHINVAFAQIRNKSIYLDNEQYESLSQVVSLKKFNPKLKVLLSIGGAQDDKGFPDMVVNHTCRKIFIKSVKTVLMKYALDGIDLDWEFPAVHVDVDITKRERQHFSQLLREIRMEYRREKRDYLLTVAVAAPESIVDTAYDVDQINLYVDYVNVMTYDFHAFTKYTPFTGLNSPLYARDMEQMFLSTLNINYTVQMYLKKGLDRSKIVVGVPTYGHSFTLINANNTGVGSPASGYGTLGGLGFVNYPDICKFIEDFKSEVVIELDSGAKVPYLHRGQEWVSYDTPQSALEKAHYIKEHGLRGAMIYSLNADDYAGVCDQNPRGSLKFPLAVSVKNALIANMKLDSKILNIKQLDISSGI